MNKHPDFVDILDIRNNKIKGDSVKEMATKSPLGPTPMVNVRDV